MGDVEYDEKCIRKTAPADVFCQECIAPIESLICLATYVGFTGDQEALRCDEFRPRLQGCIIPTTGLIIL